MAIKVDFSNCVIRLPSGSGPSPCPKCKGSAHIAFGPNHAQKFHILVWCSNCKMNGEPFKEQNRLDSHQALHSQLTLRSAELLGLALGNCTQPLFNQRVFEHPNHKFLNSSLTSRTKSEKRGVLEISGCHARSLSMRLYSFTILEPGTFLPSASASRPMSQR